MSKSANPSAFRAWLRAELARRCRAGASELSATADLAAIGGDASHHAILALVATDDFTPDARFVARVLDLSVDEVNLALQRLARVGLLEMRSEAWVDVFGLGVLEPDAFELAVWQHALAQLGAAPRGDAAPVAERANGPSPVKRFQILAKNPEAVAAFYSRLFGWSIDAQNALGYRQIATGGLDGGIWPVPPGAPAFVQLFVEVRDVAAACRNAAELGAAVLLPPQSLPDGDEMAVLRDPEGVTFGVFRGQEG